MVNLCPCYSGKIFALCCQPLLEDREPALSSLMLMRSRYTAFAQKNMEYILKTHDPRTFSLFDLAGNSSWAQSVEFFKLEIIRDEESNGSGLVEFRAHYRAQGKSLCHHEISTFRNILGRWYFCHGRSPS